MRYNYWSALEPGCTYHIYNLAVGNENLFLNARNYFYFLSRWRKYIDPFFSTCAYCLMPNHFHFLAAARPLSKNIENLIKTDQSSAALKYLMGSIPIQEYYASRFKALFNSFNKEQERHGSLFQAKFKRILVRNEMHFIRMFLYIHHNPIHHKFVADYLDWPYSSYQSYVEETDAWLNKSILFDYLAINSDIQLKKFHEIHNEYKNANKLLTDEELDF